MSCGLIYFTPVQAKEAGFLETEHFGVLFRCACAVRGAVPAPDEPLRPDRHPAALATGPDLGLHRRSAPVTGMPAHGKPHRRVAACGCRAGCLPGTGGTGRRSRSCLAAPRAYG